MATMRPIDRLGLGPKREAVRGNDGLWAVTVTPPDWSGFKSSTIKLTENQYARYLAWLQTGHLIQDVLPDLSPAEREILLSGIGDNEFAELRDEDT